MTGTPWHEAQNGYVTTDCKCGCWIELLGFNGEGDWMPCDAHHDKARALLGRWRGVAIDRREK